MWHKATRELFDYWNGLRGERPAPERSELDLAAIRGLIANMFMLEIDAARLFPFVLSGTRVNALACTEQNGRSFLDLWAPCERRKIAALLLTIMDAACPLMVTAGASPDGWQKQGIEILLLPLGNGTRGRIYERARILGLIVPSPQPTWLGLLPAQDFTLLSVQSPDPSRETYTAPAGDAAAFRTAPAHWGLADQPVKNVGHLRVFSGGRQIP